MLLSIIGFNAKSPTTFLAIPIAPLQSAFINIPFEEWNNPRLTRLPKLGFLIWFEPCFFKGSSTKLSVFDILNIKSIFTISRSSTNPSIMSNRKLFLNQANTHNHLGDWIYYLEYYSKHQCMSIYNKVSYLYNKNILMRMSVVKIQHSPFKKPEN